MSYSTIYISNVLESYYRGYNKLPEEQMKGWYRYDFLEENRALLYGKDNKIVITSYPINSDYLSDLSRIVKWENVQNWFPSTPSPAISLDIINNTKLRDKIITAIKQNPGISLIQYRSTPEFHKLVSYLKSLDLDFVTPELIESSQEFVLDYYNTKRGFRHLWSEVMGQNTKRISIPQGFICADLKEAIYASWWFRQKNKNFVVKYNKGVQGIGVVLNKAKDFSLDRKEFEEQLKNKLTEEMWRESTIIVEELIVPDNSKLGGSPDVEFYIDKKGKVIFSYPCEQILERGKKFIGIYFHKELLKTKQMQAAKKAGLVFGRGLSNMGYRGVFDIDLVINKEGKVYAVEANLRRTGGTHLHEFATNLLGKDYWQKYYVMSLDLRLKHSCTYLEAKQKLETIAFDDKTKQGVILANPDLLSEKIVIPILISRTKQGIDRLFEKVKDLFL